MLQSIGSQRVRHDWATELTECISLTNGVQHNIISWMLPSKTSCPMVYLQDSGYGKDSVQFFDKLQIYCRDTVIRVFKISKAFLFRDLNLIFLCFPELCYTAFLCISGNLFKHSSIQSLKHQVTQFLFLNKVYGGKLTEDKDSWYYPWDQSNLKDSQFLSDKCSISATPCELCLCHRLSPSLSAIWVVVATAVRVAALVWPLPLQTSNLRTEHSFLFKEIILLNKIISISHAILE